MKKLSLLLAIISACLGLNGQQTINGRIYHQNTNEPLPFVNISGRHPNQSTSTDLKGQFTIQLDSLEQEITISHLGFKTKEIAVNTAMQELNIALEPGEINLQEVSILAEIAQER
ncbi:MAG: carboxypeptidase-like regulatory domain-containing protein, partial [Bacteroidales bacterium]